MVRSPTLPANGPGPAPRLGEGPVTPRAPGEVALSRDSWGPGPPAEPQTSRGVPGPRRVPDTHILSDTPPGAGPEPPRVRRCGHALAGPPGFHWKTHLLAAFNAVSEYALCHSRARCGICQVALLVACYQGAQCSHWRRPRRVCQSTMPVEARQLGFAHHDAYIVLSTDYAASYVSPTGASPI